MGSISAFLIASPAIMAALIAVVWLLDRSAALAMERQEAVADFEERQAHARADLEAYYREYGGLINRGA